ncbi:glycoside hydrolase family 16 protein [Gelatoporia subvermispora B]|uniref:Glycoside hydrolase family 16 protein n=1 Tax=Ceriporiopsis subvermispora (strain B) TaxID=914234 RepID=M2P6T9_CERS8|nr:glycoside hydrolase family 16 protein [Gelatoporia subvermispora B]
MISFLLLYLCVFLLTSVGGQARKYSLHQNNVGADFLENFVWEITKNPPGGRVMYTMQSDALSQNLVNAHGNTFVMRVDDTATLSSSDLGRKSVRIKTKEQYTTHVAVFDIRHMPQGYGTWPALWEADDTVGVANGELDIMEGVNNVSPSYTTLHTGGSCTMPANRTQKGTAKNNDCRFSSGRTSGYSGCTVASPYSSTYGPTFNANGGGYYVLERTPEAISVWFWSRNDKSVPASIKDGSHTIDTTSWNSPPIAYFLSSPSCDLSANMKSHSIIINTMLCGPWAGSRFDALGIQGTCIDADYVNDNPSAFKDAYWDIAALRIYLKSSDPSYVSLMAPTPSSVPFVPEGYPAMQYAHSRESFLLPWGVALWAAYRLVCTARRTQ